jgi:hypothetical protein
MALKIPRDRNCYILKKGDTLPVAITTPMAAQGWLGGQGVMWQDSPSEDFLVTYSDGSFGGFFFWGSNEPSDVYTSITGNQPRYGFGTLAFGSWVIATSTYERYTYLSRQGGPLVPITYAPDDRLRFSLRGYFTSEDEFTLSGDPRAPNLSYVGNVAQPPNLNNGWYLTVHTNM